MADFDAIFKVYDIRGTVPDQIDAGAAPVGADIRLGEIEAMVRADPDPAPVSATGRRTRRDLLAECMAQVRSFVDTTALRPLQVVRGHRQRHRRLDGVGCSMFSKMGLSMIPKGMKQRMSKLSIPSEADLLYPTVCALRDLGGSGHKSELVRRVIEIEGYSSNEELMALKRRLGWVLTALKGISVVENTSRGYWSLTKKGLMIDEVKIRSDHADYRKRIT